MKSLTKDIYFKKKMNCDIFKTPRVFSHTMLLIIILLYVFVNLQALIKLSQQYLSRRHFPNAPDLPPSQDGKEHK